LNDSQLYTSLSSCFAILLPFVVIMVLGLHRMVHPMRGNIMYAAWLYHPGIIAKRCYDSSFSIMTPNNAQHKIATRTCIGVVVTHLARIGFVECWAGCDHCVPVLTCIGSPYCTSPLGPPLFGSLVRKAQVANCSRVVQIVFQNLLVCVPWVLRLIESDVPGQWGLSHPGCLNVGAVSCDSGF